MTNKHIARALSETASLIELSGGNSFRARAFINAARTIDRLDEQAVDLLADGSLTNIRGIGKGLVDQIGELVETGTFALRDELLGSIPPGVVELLRVKGIGAKKARTLWKTLSVTSVEDLEEAAAIGRLAELPGFGERTQETVLSAARTFLRYRSARHYAAVYSSITPLVTELRALAGVRRAEITGSLRRKMETVSSADLLIAGAVDVVEDALAGEYDLSREETDDGVSLTGTLHDGLPLIIRFVPEEQFGTIWWKTTGSSAHVEHYLERFGQPPKTASEEAVFDVVNLSFIPPELREDDRAFDAASDGRLPRLITVSDLRGSLHNHSTYSDGAHSLSDMAAAAFEMGLSYFGICDHSRSLTIANGMSVERVQQQQAEIRELNELYASKERPFYIFSGIESDILENGELDYSEEILATFDFVVASIHSHFTMTEDAATARLIAAIENPYTSILGHMTGRLLLSRDGYPVNHRKVIDACAANSVAIELNANPYRLDMDWRWLPYALDRGVLV
ncbi:MAG: helix-hairpin-helix domain-containing protein, partial [Bacteroidota bacterium]